MIESFEIDANITINSKIHLEFIFEEAPCYPKKLWSYSVHAIDALKILINQYQDFPLIFRLISYNFTPQTAKYQIFYYSEEKEIPILNASEKGVSMTFYYSFD